MKFYGSLFVLFIFIAGCAPQMSQVMNSCDGYKKFDSYVSCVKLIMSVRQTPPLLNFLCLLGCNCRRCAQWKNY